MNARWDVRHFFYNKRVYRTQIILTSPSHTSVTVEYLHYVDKTGYDIDSARLIFLIVANCTYCRSQTIFFKIRQMFKTYYEGQYRNMILKYIYFQRNSIKYAKNKQSYTNKIKNMSGIHAVVADVMPQGRQLALTR
jgi:hypothetical protein